MGFATGFTGGVTFTLGVTYLAVLSHQRTRQRQCDLIAANTRVLRALASSDPAAAIWLSSPEPAAPASAPSTVLPGTAFARQPAGPRQPQPRFVDELKDRWNAEVEGAVRRVQTTDWISVREDAGAAIAHLWTQAFGSASASVPAEAPTPAPASAPALTFTPTTVLKETATAAAETAPTKATKPVAAAANTAKGTAKDAAKDAETAPKSELTDVKLALQRRYAKTDDAPVKKTIRELLEERYKHAA